MINMKIDKTILNIFYELINANNKRKVGVAEKVCKRLHIPFSKENFKSMKVFSKTNEINDEEIKCFQINFKNHEVEIDILEDRYYIIKRHNDNEYQFIKQFLYEENFLIEETFSLDIDENNFVAISEIYPSSAICIENDDKCIMRSHTNDSYIDLAAKEIHAVKSFINEVNEKDEYDYQEVTYFLSKEEMYYTKIRKSLNNGALIAGISLDKPNYTVNYRETNKEEKLLYKNLGLLEESNIKRPKMYIYGIYGINKSFEINLVKSFDIIYIKYTENKNSKIIKINGNNKRSISIEELMVIKETLINEIGDKEYYEWIDEFIDEAIRRATIRKEKNLRDITSFNSDILDHMILEGKGIYGNQSDKTIEQRAVDIYNGKEVIPKWFDVYNIKPLKLNIEHQAKVANK